jgi:cold shock CspA family protein
VKLHEESPHAIISKVFPDKNYGFLTTPDGMDVYFHEHSVINKDFGRLKVGMKVRFVMEEGDKGPQASTVTVI